MNISKSLKLSLLKPGDKIEIYIDFPVSCNSVEGYTIADTYTHKYTSYKKGLYEIVHIVNNAPYPICIKPINAPIICSAYIDDFKKIHNHYKIIKNNKVYNSFSELVKDNIELLKSKTIENFINGLNDTDKLYLKNILEKED